MSNLLEQPQSLTCEEASPRQVLGKVLVVVLGKELASN
jgi:hypothetical protein